VPVHENTTPIRVGVDLASVEDVRGCLAAYGRRYTRRIFTATEVAACSGNESARAESLAARFAAKEAVLKVLHCPAEPPAWTDIEVERTPGGWCVLHLSGRAATMAGEAGLDHWAVSLTHEAGMAAAVVVASGSA
jgi:holo-[acyl-carrier protein] synthase